MKHDLSCDSGESTYSGTLPSGMEEKRSPPLVTCTETSAQEAAENVRHAASAAAEMLVRTALLYDEARQAIAAREHLMAVVAHDLRNSLSLALMTVSVLDMPLEMVEASPVTSRVGALRKGLGRMQRLLDDLLDFASLETGHLSLYCSSQDAAALVQEALETFREQAASKGVFISADLPNEACPLECDRDRILQALANLIGNALKFTPPGGAVTLTVTNRDNEIEFSVADTGCGIAPAELERIFAAYYRASRTGASGMGLGLSITKGIVESHGGKVWVESRLGTGTTFYFQLPKHSRAPGT